MCESLKNKDFKSQLDSHKKFLKKCKCILLPPTPDSVNAFEQIFRKKEKKKNVREVSSCKMSFSDTLIFPKSRVLSAKKADKDSFPRALLVSYGIFGL